MAIKDMNDSKKWEAFCEKLIEMSRDHNIAWEDRSEHIKRPDSISPLFVAEYKEWHILIYKYSYKYFYDEEQFDWQEDVLIELIQEDGKTKWTLPKTPSRYELLEIVQFQNANVELLLNDILGD